MRRYTWDVAQKILHYHHQNNTHKHSNAVPSPTHVSNNPNPSTYHFSSLPTSPTQPSTTPSSTHAAAQTPAHPAAPSGSAPSTVPQTRIQVVNATMTVSTNVLSSSTFVPFFQPQMFHFTVSQSVAVAGL